MRWIVRGLAVLAGLVMLFVVILYAGSEWVLRRGHQVPQVAIAVPRDAASIAEGGRLAKIVMCRDCHAADGQGQVIVSDPMFGTIAPPPIAEMAAKLSDAELARLIRHGVKRDGSSTFTMPSHSLGRIADDDLGKIIAWVRTLKPGPKDSKVRSSYGPIGRFLLLTGTLPAMANPANVSTATRPADTGRYYVNVACLACHKLHEAGTMEDGTTKVPALAPMAASYDPAAFARLMRTGQGMSKRDLGLMGVVARNGFSAFTDGEIAAVQAYLKGEAEKGPR
ncbi:c-type cytochrome [Sphingomonas sp. HITSZ_GF]|uniref:c-type cytochrome n=1 Tax=Sphingomonas sp. HITSZ_GF TaxID=3037247 RepID=UPI00240E5662|nr:c-type cytochrome [Sphingomonas sp. HITSZ_GF]MDG2534844.1 c-type cytochrome [Sphingomonas sp. HITSZ_GF]